MIYLVFLSFSSELKGWDEGKKMAQLFLFWFNHIATYSLLGQPEPGFHYIQKFYKSHTKITLLNKETHIIFYSQKSSLTPYKNHTQRFGITLGKQPEAQELQNLMVALPSQPYTSSSS